MARRVSIYSFEKAGGEFYLGKLFDFSITSVSHLLINQQKKKKNTPRFKSFVCEAP